MKNLKTKNRILSVALILVSIVALAGVARANSDFLNILADEVADRLLGGAEEQELGALSTETPTNLDEDEWTAFYDIYADDVEIEDDLWVGDDFTLGGDFTGAGMTLTGDLAVDGDIASGGGVLATSTANTSETLLAGDICDYSYIEYTPNTGDTIVALPATSTISTCLDTAGDHRTIIFENATSTATNVTIAAGAGMDLQEPDGQNVVAGQNNFAQIDFWKRSDGDIVVVIDETIPAD